MLRIRVFFTFFINLLQIFCVKLLRIPRKGFKAGHEINTNVSKEIADHVLQQVQIGGDIFGLASTKTPERPDVASYTVILKGK